MAKKTKAPTGEVVYISKEVNTPEPPTIDIPIQGTDTSAPAPPPAPTPVTAPAPVTASAPSAPVEPTVKAKRVYRKKNPQYWEAMTQSRKEMLMPALKNEIIVPVEPKEPIKATKSVKAVRKAPTPAPAPAPAPVKKTVKIQAPKKKKKAVVYESSEEEEEEEESESDEEIVERVAQKTHKRISTLQKIDNRLKELKNPYSAVGRFSVF